MGVECTELCWCVECCNGKRESESGSEGVFELFEKGYRKKHRLVIGDNKDDNNDNNDGIDNNGGNGGVRFVRHRKREGKEGKSRRRRRRRKKQW